MTDSEAGSARVAAVPRETGFGRDDRRWPAVVAASLLLHAAAIMAVLLAQMRDTTTRPREIPIELVELPPPQKAPAPRPPPPKPSARQAAAKPPPTPPKPAQRSVADRVKDLLGPMPGFAALALPGEAEAGEAVSYSRIVMSRIGKAKKQGRYRGVPGFATVAFTLGDGGEVTALELKRPSGDPSLDTEAVDLVKRAEPYPPPPPGGRRAYVVTLEFRALPD